MPASIHGKFNVPDFAIRDDITSGRGFLKLSIAGLTPGNDEDGDILAAVNWRQVRHRRAKELIFARDSLTRRHDRGNIANGILPATDVAKDYFDATHEFRIERISETVMRVIRLSDMLTKDYEDEVQTTDPFHPTAGYQTKKSVKRYYHHMLFHVRQHNARGRACVGNPDNVIFWEGQKDRSRTNLDTIWEAIETKLGLTEDSEVTDPEFGDYRKSLVIPVNDFTDAQETEYNSQLSDNRPKWKVPGWAGLPGVVPGDVTNPGKAVRIHGPADAKNIHGPLVLEKS